MTSSPSAAVRRPISLATALLLCASLLVGFAPTAARAATTVVFDDMEHGDPTANGWFTFNGIGGGGISATTADLPPGTSGSYALETGWGSGGTPGFYGGFGREHPVDIAGTTDFKFWINPDAAQAYTLEVNLQDDATGDGTLDDEFQFDCVVGPAGPCAVSGGGWQQVTIPLADFARDTSFLSGGNGVLDDRIVNVVVAVIGTGSDVNFRTDDWVFTDAPAGTDEVVDDFEGDLAEFFTFSDGSPVAISTTTAPPAPVPGSITGNAVLQMDAEVTAYAGFIHAFGGESPSQWVPQDWSGREGLALWLYGTGSGTSLFLDLLENRTPGSTVDDAERWTVTFADDVAGWRRLELPFSSFTRKEIGNGAPNDGLTLFEVNGWAFGALTTPGETTFHLDDVTLYGDAPVADLAVSFSSGKVEIPEGTTGEVAVRLNRPFVDGDPDQVSVDYATEPGTAEPGRDYTPTSGTLTFTRGGPTEQTFSIETTGDNTFLGDERIVLRLSNPVDVALGSGFQASAIIVDDDPYDPRLVDGFERGAYLWHADDGIALDTHELGAGDDPRPGQDVHESVLEVATPQLIEAAVGGNLCAKGNGVVPITILTTDAFDATTVDVGTVRVGDAGETHVDRRTGEPRRHLSDVDGDGDIDLVVHVRAAEVGGDCSTSPIVTGETGDGQAILTRGAPLAFGRDFTLPQDFSRDEALRFWFHGTGSGDEIGVTLKDNGAPDPGPAGWELAWSDEFDGPAGSPPDPANWSHELGDVTPDGKNGWGNDERQYYTDDPANAATDGDGNLVISLREADPADGLQCYYGPCEYTSARLNSWHKSEFAYGRVESRVKLPTAGDDLDGLWPAFWSLGADIDRNPWPGAGEIDIMEWVGRIPNEIFGTIHGPGYSGGASFGDTSALTDRDGFHDFAIEWEPAEIRWYLDGALYHTATPADVAPDAWVFDKPFFLLLNFAVGGNFGGSIGEDVQFPQEYEVDYVRVYGAPDTAERFEASFTDDVAGWREVVVPFAAFTRSDEQPAGAPDDGLGLTQVNGYGFTLPEGGTTAGSLRIDEARRVAAPPPAEVVVTSLADGSRGSLRDAVAYVADGGTIRFDPALADQTMALTRGPITLDRDVTIDAGDAPGVTVDGGGVDRVLVVDAGTSADVSGLAMTGGYGYQLAGCVLNNGDLTLDHVTVSGCTMTTDAGDFWQGGGGIYNGDGASLHLVDSTVGDNTADWSGGGVYSFFNTTTVVERSTIAGNVSGDVGGGLRLLGNATITDSTISGNTSTGWYGGALFVTDGAAELTHVTVADNTSPAAGPADLFVGTFGTSGASLVLTNSIVASAGDNCFVAYFGSGPVTLASGGGNVFTDGTCALTAGDQVVADAGLGTLGDNGGPTATHALLPDSPAIDAADAAACTASDQRGVTRPQGSACDVGAYELEVSTAGA